MLDDNGIRPPLIAAGINLFGGPLGLIHKHVTGAVPIRRATKDPIYLTTLKAYVAELLRHHDLFFYPEGGRSYSGEMKPHKTGILHAVLQSGVKNVLLIPVAIAYDLVLEDRAISRQGVKKRQRPFTYELAEMVGLAVGYRSRAFVTFGAPIAVGAYDPDSRKDALDLAHLTRDTIGRLYKVLPTAIVANAMRPSITRADLESRVDAALDHLSAAGANLLLRDVQHVVEDGVSRLEQRGVIQAETDRLRVRDRNVLRYYARIDSAPAAGLIHTIGRIMLDALSKSFFHALARSKSLERHGLAHRHGQAHEFRAALHRRRNGGGGHRGRQGHPGQGPAAHPRPAGRERHDAGRGREPPRRSTSRSSRRSARRASTATSR